jgi:hypothetical protein
MTIDKEKSKYKGEYTAIRVDAETARMLRRIASVNDRTMLAQARAIIKREYVALEKRGFQPTEEKPTRRKYTRKTDNPVEEVDVSKEPAKKPVRRGFLWWGRD